MRSKDTSKDLLSISPVTNKTYKIPKKIDDKENIDQFLSKNKDKKIIVVQGLGYVGSVMAVVCANAIDGEWFGYAAYPTKTLSDTVSVTVRYEYFQDEGDTKLGFDDLDTSFVNATDDGT